MAEQRQVAVFNKEDRAVVNVNELQKNIPLEPFLKLSETIKDSTGNVPPKVVPCLVRLLKSYSSIDMKIKTGLSSTCASCVKIVIKTDAIIKRGVMYENDYIFLNNLGKKLNSDYVTELEKFVDEARNDLIEICNTIMSEAVGKELEGMLNERTCLEQKLLKQMDDLSAKASTKGRSQGQIDSLQYEIQICDIAITNSAEAKKVMEDEVKRLKDKVSEYENQVQAHRNYAYQERGSCWIFSWKVRDVHVDNGERIAKENLDRLLGRIRDLQNNLNNWSNSNFTERRKKALEERPRHQAEQETFAKAYAEAEKQYEKLRNEFNTVCEKIEQIYEASGTRNQETIKMVDKLAIGIQSASAALVQAYAAIRTHLEVIDLDPDLLKTSMSDALQLIAFADYCNSTNKLRDVATQLAIC
ncbi:unnamed protein product [Rotaria sp. Silwood2]|nr:unnamed protein product [Rotaria sp. Silwood2]CAF4532805.1 unnamed protein product [Rotaria sp. Silwood2]